MALDKTQLIGYAAIIIIIVSLVFIGLRLTGYATVQSTGVVNVSIQNSAAINFTANFVNFTTGFVTPGQTSAIVDTEGTLTGGTGWTPSGNLTIENIGNVNVTLSLQSSVNASAFIGGVAGGGPHFKIKVINVTEPLSCAGNVNASAYTEINTTDLEVCSNFPYQDTSDQVTVLIQLVIPSDSYSSATTPRTATITATGTY